MTKKAGIQAKAGLPAERLLLATLIAMLAGVVPAFAQETNGVNKAVDPVVGYVSAVRAAQKMEAEGALNEVKADTRINTGQQQQAEADLEWQDLKKEMIEELKTLPKSSWKEILKSCGFTDEEQQEILNELSILLNAQKRVSVAKKINVTNVTIL